MAGPAAHGQHNKPHKRGRHAGAGARAKHKTAKEGGRAPIRSGQNAVAAGRLQRQNETKQLRERKRSQSLAQRRREGPPIVVAFLPLSADVDASGLWQLVLGAFAGGSKPGAEPKAKKGAPEPMEEDPQPLNGEKQHPLVPTTVAVPGRPKQRFVLLPPPRDREDPLAAVDLARSAEVVLAVLPGQPKAVCLDGGGQQALSVLRQMGMPALVGVVTTAARSGSGDTAGAAAPAQKLKERAAARKRAAAVLQSEVAGEHKMVAVDDAADCGQLLRLLGETQAGVPLWRRQRPCVLADAAHFTPDAAQPDRGTLAVRGYVRNLGLSANQLVTLPGAGDFQLLRIESAPEPAALGVPRRAPDQAIMDADGAGGSRMVVVPDPAQQESLARENVPDPLAGEQTWPTDNEMAEAEEDGRKRRRLPKGTSEYQAAWILDDDDEDGPGDLMGSISEGEELEGEEQQEQKDEQEEAGVRVGEEETASLLGGATTAGGGATEFGDDEDADRMEDDEESGSAAAPADMKRRWREQQDDVLFPDEMDTPRDVAARVRFAKYRGLRSWRSSEWDPKEGLPQEYGRVFAFQNPTRAQKRAKAAAEAVGGPQDDHGVPAGSYVVVHIARVPSAAAAALVARVSAFLQGEAAPLAVFGLLQHEAKLSVLNFGVRKAAALEEPLPNKAPLLLVTGVRSFDARPVFSADEAGGTRFKMERFLHPGRAAVATVYGPIAFGPLPLLAFQRCAGGGLRLAAAGALRSCDPDRVVLKKVVLSGYPVRVHKLKAVVRWMFYTPEDIRWFRPLELWTKHGRRGRIKESMGTHGSMKCIFDGPIKQQDAVCVSLYKRAFPVWPAEGTLFA